MISLLGIKQQNNILNDQNRMLDLVLTDMDCTVRREDLPLTKEDAYHPSLSICVNPKDSNIITPVFPTNTLNRRYNFRRADFPSLYRHICEKN